MLINVYLPCDDRYRSGNYFDLVDTLSQISCIIGDCEVNSILLAGDFNCDFSRNSPHVAAVREFIAANDLFLCLNHPTSDVDYTFECKASGSFSLIDHFAVSNEIFAEITKYCTVSSIDNSSDHDAVVCKMNIDVSYVPKSTRKFSPRPAWHKATDDMIEQYQQTLDYLLMQIEIDYVALECSDVRCDKHSPEISKFLQSIVNSCLQAEDKNIPKTGRSAKQRIPGWNDHVSGKRSEALHWHRQWVDTGRPRHGRAYEERKRTRKEYHQSIKYCKKQENVLKSQKMAEALVNSRRDVWSEVRKLNKNVKSLPNVIDGANTPQDILKTFKEKFSKVFSSVPTSGEDMELLQSRIDNGLPTRCTMVTPNLDELIKKLKSGKGDGFLGLNSDCVIHAPRRLTVLVSLLFRAMTVHGFVPEVLLLGTMAPIPKGKGYSTSSDKYRSITLSSCLLKLYDYMLLESQKSYLSTDNLQFGFKEKSSTTMCTSILMEIVQFFRSRGSAVHAVMLDASKAFDRIEYACLFNALLDKGMDVLYVRCLLYMYSQQKLRVKWNGFYSESFPVHNGVKQGGVISPILFGIYMDILIMKLRDSGYGCYLGPHFMGCLAYADDLVLLSTTKFGLTQMLGICKEYSRVYQVEFNGLKSQYITFDPKLTSGSLPLEIFGSIIRNQSVAIHLGHKIYADCRTDDFEGIISSFYRQYNSFRCKFGAIASMVQAELFESYCCSFYGSLLLTHQKIEKIGAVWRKTVRAIWKLPWRTHCKLIACLSKSLCSRHTFLARFGKFALNVLTHSIAEVRFCYTAALGTKFSVFGRNMEWCRNALSFALSDFHQFKSSHVTRSVWNLCNAECKTDECKASAQAVAELTGIKDNIHQLNFPISKNDIDLLIMDICVN